MKKLIFQDLPPKSRTRWLHLFVGCLIVMIAPIALGSEIIAPPAAKSDPPELPLLLKSKVPIIFVGQIKDIVSGYDDRMIARTGRVGTSVDLMVLVHVLKTIKSPDGKPLPDQVYLRFGGIFERPRGLESTWEEMTSTFAGHRFVFFGYDVTQVSTAVLLVNSGRPIKPEKAEKEQEVRRFLRLKN